jgi:hypothetical protein
MKVKTLDQLVAAGTDKKSVICPGLWHRAYPAAWVLNWQAWRVHAALTAGILIYQPKTLKKHFAKK